MLCQLHRLSRRSLAVATKELLANANHRMKFPKWWNKRSTSSSLEGARGSREEAAGRPETAASGPLSEREGKGAGSDLSGLPHGRMLHSASSPQLEMGEEVRLSKDVYDGGLPGKDLAAWSHQSTGRVGKSDERGSGAQVDALDHGQLVKNRTFTG